MYKCNKSELESQYLTKDKLLRRQAWESFIVRDDISWDWFATLTFRDYKSIYSTKRHYYRWLRVLNRSIFGHQVKRVDVSISWVTGYERQTRGAYHIHALLSNTDYLMRKHWAKVWWTLTGGYAKILPAEYPGAVHYLTKYILKDGEIDLDLRNEAGQHLTLDDPVGYTKAEEGRQEVLTGFLLPSEAI